MVTIQLTDEQWPFLHGMISDEQDRMLAEQQDGSDNDAEDIARDLAQLKGIMVALDSPAAPHQNHDWVCGCGHWNGPNLDHCGMCNRTPQESLPASS